MKGRTKERERERERIFHPLIPPQMQQLELGQTEARSLKYQVFHLGGGPQGLEPSLAEYKDELQQEARWDAPSGEAGFLSRGLTHCATTPCLAWLRFYRKICSTHCSVSGGFSNP